MRRLQAFRQQGMALVGALIVVLVVTLLGALSFRLAVQEVDNVRAIKEEAAVRRVAEAGLDLAIEWFHDPAKVAGHAVAASLQKRFALPDEGPAFFDAQGRSQFRGTAGAPDIVLDGDDPVLTRVLNDPAMGAARWGARLLTLKLYGPAQPALLCTVEATAEGTRGLRRTVSAQLTARRIPAIRSGILLTGNGSDPAAAGGLPIWVHWGDVRVRGGARLPKIEDLPTQAAGAPVNALSYGEMTRREDRWLNVYIGGSVTFLPSTVVPAPPAPSNVHGQQEPLPGLREDRWTYDMLKQQATAHGEVYTRGPDGLLYRDGQSESGPGLSLESVMRSAEVDDHRGLIFVDTLDRQPPRADNLGTMAVEADYAEGLFVINANLRFKPNGPGRSVRALAPPDPGTLPLASRVAVQLSGMHLRGVLFVAGDLTYEGRPRMFGALLAGGRVVSDGSGSGPLELWTDFELSQGLVRGMPLVSIAPGTWRE
jgi:type II secretory pathway pseudopilin PulG